MGKQGKNPFKFKNRGIRFARDSKRFGPGRPPKGRTGQPMRKYMVGENPVTPGSPAAYCSGRKRYMGGTVSISECYVAWALEKIIGPENEGWSYQQNVRGGNRMPGGSIPDFLVEGDPPIILRIQTFFFHLGAGSEKHQADLEQKLELMAMGYEVIDLWEQDYINDRSGRGVMKVVRDALNLIQAPNPIAGGVVRPT